MKNIMIILWLFLLIPALTVAEEDSSAEEDYSKYPGYVDLTALEGFKKADKSVEVYLKKPLLSLVAALSGNEDPALQQLISNLVLIRVENFEIEENEKEKIEDIISNVSKKLTRDKWEKIVRAVDKKEHVEIFLRIIDTKIAGLLVMAMEDNKEVAFINIVGEIDLALLGKLGAKFNIPNLDQIMPEAEGKKQ